jgi:hypothetical protein
MVHNPTRVSGLPPPQFTSVVHGRALCVGDIWGHNHPVPSTTAELFDRRATTPAGAALLDSQTTEKDGSFTVTATINLESNPWALQLTNDFTGETYVKESAKLLTLPSVVNPAGNLINVDFDLGNIILPWNPQLPLLARIGNRDFKHPDDLARRLAVMLRERQGALWLLLEFDLGNPVRDRDLDQMFRDLAAAAAAGSTDLAKRVAAEVSSALNLNTLGRRPSNDDIFTIALQRIAGMGAGEVFRQRKGQRLGDALKKAFAALVTPPSFFQPLPALACASALIYAAGHVARGHQVGVRLSSLVSMAFAHKHRHYKMIDITIS